MNYKQEEKPFIITIVGSGTAGLLASLILRKAFPIAGIKVISSSKIGIIGVGEGSTEHWRQFVELCDIPIEEMLVETSGTHKYGIRFENWTTKNPDYFHSVGDVDDIYAFGAHATYMQYLEEGKLLTPQITNVALVKDKISKAGMHRSTNQYHFDTHKLNNYLITLAFNRHIEFIEAEVDSVNLDSENGNILSVVTKSNETISSDFWFDASGFSRILMKKLGADDWSSFSDYLLCDTAIAFPTESDPNGRIRPYTRARAASSGWLWELPTQERRGNGYVFSSRFITEEEAVREAEEMSGYKIEAHRVINFDAGYLKNTWVKNCCAIGLASSFVEPLEASSIGSTIQQVKQIVPYLASYQPGHTASQKHFNASMKIMMRNILTMVRLHYYSDRQDTSFWREMSVTPLNEELQEMIELWAERPPTRFDFNQSSGEMFLSAHLWHVAQGQNAINPDAATTALNRLGIRQSVEKKIAEYRANRNTGEHVDHATALREIVLIDKEWNQ